MEKYLTLNTGAKMPLLGLGTWKSPPNEVGAAVECAILECGYKHIDCASVYQNEPEIGNAFSKIFSSGQIKREEIFITSKLWNNKHAKNEVLNSCRSTLRDLQLDYLDLYLVHWGVATPLKLGHEPIDQNGVIIPEKIPMRETWEAMENLVSAGLVKNIGVANFTAPMLVDLLSYAKITPAVNQIELHPYLQQTKLVAYCQYNDIAVTAYSPLGRPSSHGQNMPELILDPLILKLAAKYKKTSAQILLRWALERGTISIPKSTNPERLKENLNVFDFKLSTTDLAELTTLNKNLRFVDPYEWWKMPYFD